MLSKISNFSHFSSAHSIPSNIEQCLIMSISHAHSFFHPKYLLVISFVNYGLLHCTTQHFFVVFMWLKCRNVSIEVPLTTKYRVKHKWSGDFQMAIECVVEFQLKKECKFDCHMIWHGILTAHSISNVCRCGSKAKCVKVFHGFDTTFVFPVNFVAKQWKIGMHIIRG